MPPCTHTTYGTIPEVAVMQEPRRLADLTCVGFWQQNRDWVLPFGPARRSTGVSSGIGEPGRDDGG
jgi:hypothetical protein